jgi:hypothetical protein
MFSVSEYETMRHRGVVIGIDVIWLLELPGTVVGLLIIVVTVTLSVLGLLAFRRFVPQERLKRASTMLEQVFSLAGVMYAVLVAFVMVVVWQQFDDAEKAARSEATAVSDLLRDSDALPPASRPVVQKSLIDYLNDVVDDEFPRMGRGESVELQSAQLTEVWRTYISVQPVTHTEIAFYREAISRLDDLGSSRKVRTAANQEDIPGELWALLLGGGVLMLVFTYMFDTPNLAVHASGVALSSALMGFVLYLVFALEHPFVGSISVDPDVYRHVVETWSHPSQ